MTGGDIVRYLSTWIARRDEHLQQQLEALRSRDGDICRRCRRELRFDLPSDHGLAPTIQPIGESPVGAATSIDELCLCHGRCNAEAVDIPSETKKRAV